MKFCIPVCVHLPTRAEFVILIIDQDDELLILFGLIHVHMERC